MTPYLSLPSVVPLLQINRVFFFSIHSLQNIPPGFSLSPRAHSQQFDLFFFTIVPRKPSFTDICSLFLVLGTKHSLYRSSPVYYVSLVNLSQSVFLISQNFKFHPFREAFSGYVHPPKPFPLTTTFFFSVS